MSINLYCHCGCGQKTALAERNDPRRGWIKGQPKRFIHNHHSRVQSPETRRKISEALVGEKHPMFGKKHTPEARAKIREARARQKISPEHMRKLHETKIGDKHHDWKGDDAGYSAIHNWLARWVIKRGRCVRCGNEGETQWANLSGEYKRDTRDYVELCAGCHIRFDRGVQKVF